MPDDLTLKDFIELSLTEICEAIEESRKKFSYIAPQTSIDPNDGKSTLIEFDVAVTAVNKQSESSSVEGKFSGQAGIAVVAKLSGDINAQDSSTNNQTSSRVSRIKLNVPVHFRYSEELKNETEQRQKKEEAEFRLAQRNSGWAG